MNTKTLEQLTLLELAEIHLDIYGLPKQLADGWVESGMGKLVTEIRQSQPRVYTGFFSPLYGAFALMDQIGEIYVDKSLPAPNSAASGIKKALYYFGGMTFDSDEMKALYGLRNSLMHNGSLLYRGRFQNGAWTGPFHRYRWNKAQAETVVLPSQPWDGSLATLKFEKMTTINVGAICDLAVKIVGKARDALAAGNLEVRLQEGEPELYYRYLHHTRPAADDSSDSDSTR